MNESLTDDEKFEQVVELMREIADGLQAQAAATNQLAALVVDMLDEDEYDEPDTVNDKPGRIIRKGET